MVIKEFDSAGEFYSNVKVGDNIICLRCFGYYFRYKKYEIIKKEKDCLVLIGYKSFTEEKYIFLSNWRLEAYGLIVEETNE
jgi:hypothetical protein